MISLARRVNKEYSVVVREEVEFHNEIVVFNKLSNFNNFNGYIDIAEAPLSIVNSIQNEKLKEFVSEILRTIINFRSFVLKDKSLFSPEEHQKTSETIINNREYQIKEVFKSYPMDNTKLNIETIDGKVCVKYTFDEEFVKSNKNNICFIVPKEEGKSFEESLLRQLIELMYTLKPTNNCDYNTFVTKDYIPVGISFAFKQLANTLVYIFNSTSYREDNLYMFDEIEIIKKIEYGKLLAIRGF